MKDYGEYVAKNINSKMAGCCILFFIFGSIFLNGLVLTVLTLIPVLGGDGDAYAFWALCFIITVGLVYPAIRMGRKAKCASFARRFGMMLNKENRPLVEVNSFYAKRIDSELANGSNFFGDTSHILKLITDSIKYGYLVNCTMEIHDGKPYITLAKKVVKDKCPYCGAPIVGVYDDTYVCQYCGNRITGVLKKK